MLPRRESERISEGYAKILFLQKRVRVFSEAEQVPLFTLKNLGTFARDFFISNIYRFLTTCFTLKTYIMPLFLRRKFLWDCRDGKRRRKQTAQARRYLLPSLSLLKS